MRAWRRNFATAPRLVKSSAQGQGWDGVSTSPAPGADPLPARGCMMVDGPTPKGAWTITTLLFFYMLVNFADKAVVGLAAVPIMTELDLTPREFGLLGSSFFFLFS